MGVGNGWKEGLGGRGGIFGKFVTTTGDIRYHAI